MIYAFRDIRDLNELVYNLNQTVAVQPWEIQADDETETKHEGNTMCNVKFSWLFHPSHIKKEV